MEGKGVELGGRVGKLQAGEAESKERSASILDTQLLPFLKERENTQVSLSEAESTKKTLEARITELTAKLTTAQKEATTAKAEVARLTTDSKNLKKELAAVTEQAQSLEKMLETSKNDAQNAQKEVTKVKKQVTEVRQELEVAREKVLAAEKWEKEKEKERLKEREHQQQKTANEVEPGDDAGGRKSVGVMPEKTPRKKNKRGSKGTVAASAATEEVMVERSGKEVAGDNGNGNTLPVRCSGRVNSVIVSTNCPINLRLQILALIAFGLLSAGGYMYWTQNGGTPESFVEAIRDNLPWQ